MSYPGNSNNSNRGGGGDPYGRAYPAGPATTVRPVLSAKAEEELATAVKKALSPDETAPKQKHVRSCIVYTWDLKSAWGFWNAIKTFPLMGDEIVTCKALVLVHKVVRQGHPSVGFLRLGCCLGAAG